MEILHSIILMTSHEYYKQLQRRHSTLGQRLAWQTQPARGSLLLALPSLPSQTPDGHFGMTERTGATPLRCLTAATNTDSVAMRER